jgi:hypothetical protein
VTLRPWFAIAALATLALARPALAAPTADDDVPLGQSTFRVLGAADGLRNLVASRALMKANIRRTRRMGTVEKTILEPAVSSRRRSLNLGAEMRVPANDEPAAR